MKYFLGVFLVILGTITFGQKISADYNFKSVDSLLRIKEEKAIIFSIQSENVDTNGASEKWAYCYLSQIENNHPMYVFSATPLTVKFDSLWSNYSRDGSMIITEKWIDSDSAISLAEQNGGKNFRTKHPNNKITAHLGQALVPNSQPEWHIKYISADNSSETLLLFIKATDKTSGNSDHHVKLMPDQYQLTQNYPNPFNPTTTISYSINKEGNVKLSVYDALGKKIAVVVDEYKPAGSYSVKFDGIGLPSGVYLYRLESGGFNASRKFILMK